MKKSDILLAAGVLLAALALYLLFRPGGEGAWAVVEIDGREIARYALAADRTVTIGEADYNVLEIAGGTAAVAEANCGEGHRLRSVEDTFYAVLIKCS